MFTFLIAAIDILIQDYAASLGICLAASVCFHICKHGINLKRTILTEKSVETIERRAE